MILIQTESLTYTEGVDAYKKIEPQIDWSRVNKIQIQSKQNVANKNFLKGFLPEFSRRSKNGNYKRVLQLTINDEPVV